MGSENVKDSQPPIEISRITLQVECPGNTNIHFISNDNIDIHFYGYAQRYLKTVKYLGRRIRIPLNLQVTERWWKCMKCEFEEKITGGIRLKEIIDSCYLEHLSKDIYMIPNTCPFCGRNYQRN